MSGPLRVGVLGCGSIGIRGVLDHLAVGDFAGRITAAAVCDTAPGRARAAAERYAIPQWFENWQEMLRNGEIDAVTLCTPISQHYEQGLAAINAGKHVHFNKTMTVASAEATELIDRAAEAGVQLVASPGQMNRPHLRKIRDLLRDGAIGRLAWAATGAGFGVYHETEGVRQGDDPLSNINPAWYWRRPGGGPLYDMTVYGLHALTGILGPARRVTAFSGVLLHEREFRGEKYPSDCDDNTLMLLDFGGSLFAFVYGTAAGSVISLFGSPSFWGAGGRIEGETINGEPLDYPGREKSAALGFNAVLPDYNERHPTLEFHVFQDLLQLADLVREGKPTPATAEHARHVIEIIEAAYLSAESGEARALQTSFAAAP